MAFHKYAFYGVSVQRLQQCKMDRVVRKAAAELLAETTAAAAAAAAKNKNS